MGLVSLIKVARPGFWPTHVWFFLLPFGQRDMFGSWKFFLGCTFVTFPLGLLAYGFNDIFDAETDRSNPRKDSWLFGARLDERALARLPLWIALVQLPFVALLVFAGGPRILIAFFALVLANAVYNVPPLAFKNRPFLDLLNQVGYLTMFVLGAWLCDVPQLSRPALAFSALFAMHCHLFGQLMDIDADRAAGRLTTACLLGVRSGKLLAALLMLCEAVLAFASFSTPLVAAFMSLGAAFFLIDALFIFRGAAYPASFSKLFFIGWNIIVLASMYSVWRSGIFVLAT